MGQIGELTRLLRESEADRDARLDQLDQASRLMRESNANHAEDLKTIEILTARSAILEARVDRESGRATDLERALGELEKMRVIRIARRFGLIKAQPTADPFASGACRREGEEVSRREERADGPNSR